MDFWAHSTVPTEQFSCTLKFLPFNKKKKFKCWVELHSICQLKKQPAVISELNQYLFFSSLLLVRQDFNTLWWNILGIFLCSSWWHLLKYNTDGRVSCEGVLTSCPDFVLGNYIPPFLIDVEYGIFLCSMSILDFLAAHHPIDAVHMGLLSYLRNLQGCWQAKKMRD